MFMSEEKLSKNPVILVFTTAYDPFIGGAEIAIKETVKRLENEFNFFILTSRFEKKLPFKEKHCGVTIIRLGFGKQWDKFLLPVFAFVSGFLLLIIHRSSPRLFWAVMA